eukprot:4752744-Lingulodinium_polyedra.AAC.1
MRESTATGGLTPLGACRPTRLYWSKPRRTDRLSGPRRSSTWGGARHRGQLIRSRPTANGDARGARSAEAFGGPFSQGESWSPARKS